MSSENEKYYHDQGEKDFAEGKGFNSPTRLFGPRNDSDVADVEAYEKGWNNSKE